MIWRNLQYVPGLLRVDSFGAKAVKAEVDRSAWDTVMVHVGEPVCAALEGPEVAVQVCVFDFTRKFDAYA